MQPVLRALLASIKSDCSFLIDLAAEVGGGGGAPAAAQGGAQGGGGGGEAAASFNFLGNALLAEVDAALAAALPLAFSPTRLPAAVFLANYASAQGFVAELEGRCSSRAALAALRGCAAAASFSARWDLAKFCDLRAAELSAGVDAALAAPALAPAAAQADSGPGSGCALRATAAVWEAVGRCWAPGFLLLPLTAHRSLGKNSDLPGCETIAIGHMLRSASAPNYL